jgi:hypothetical protein
MKRSCPDNGFKGSGSKGHANFVENNTYMACEFHKYTLNNQQINNNIYL